MFGKIAEKFLLEVMLTHDGSIYLKTDPLEGS